MENIILDYYRECLEAEEKAEQEHDADKRSAEKRRAYEYCFAQVMAIEELMEKLGIDYEEDDEDDED